MSIECDPDRPQLCSRIRDRLTYLYRYAQLTPIATLAWERALLPDERARLGSDLKRAYATCNGTPEMLVRVRGLTLGAATVAVAAAADLCSPGEAAYLRAELRRLEGPDAEGEVDEHVVVMQALTACDLVVVDGHERRVYWRGTLLRVDWRRHEKAWELIRALAECAARNGAVDWCMLGLEGPRGLTTRKANLRRAKLLPEDLFALIEPDGVGQVCLKLPPGRVRVLLLTPEL